MPLRTRCGTSRLPCMSLGVRAQGLGPRGGGTALAITICSVLPSVPYDAVGPPKFILLSRLNIQPARLPVNASPLLSRTTTHDSGPIWFATPSLGGTCTRETYRFVPAHREVKILMRLPDGRNVATRQAVYGSGPCARTEVAGRWLRTEADSPCLDDSSRRDGRSSILTRRGHPDARRCVNVQPRCHLHAEPTHHTLYAAALVSLPHRSQVRWQQEPEPRPTSHGEGHP